MSQAYELDRITIDTGDVPIIGIDELIERGRPDMTKSEYFYRKGSLEIVRDLVQIGWVDDTPRVYGATDRQELIVLPHYKVKTYPNMTLEEQRKHDIRHLLGQNDKKYSNRERTTFGSILARGSFDEIPFHVAIGTHGLFGNARPPLVPEFFSEYYREYAEQQNMTPLETAQRLQVGVFTVCATLSGRIMDEEGWPKYMRAVRMPREEWPTKLDMVKATLSKDFISQTGGSSKSQTKSKQDSSLRPHLHIVRNEFSKE